MKGNCKEVDKLVCIKDGDGEKILDNNGYMRMLVGKRILLREVVFECMVLVMIFLL